MKTRNIALVALGLLTTAPAYADPISGLVQADGSVAYQSSLYTVTHLGTGRYLIAFTNPMTPQASCVVTTLGGQNPNSYVSRIIETETSCEVVTGNNGFRSDTRFSFIAMPMSD
jgi:hypothetical protein